MFKVSRRRHRAAPSARDAHADSTLAAPLLHPPATDGHTATPPHSVKRSRDGTAATASGRGTFDVEVAEHTAAAEAADPARCVALLRHVSKVYGGAWWWRGGAAGRALSTTSRSLCPRAPALACSVRCHR
jgi:hypothetical protein